MTPTCPDTPVDRLLAGELTPREADAARAHISTCPACRAAYDRLARAVRRLEGGALPQSAVDAVARQVVPPRRAPRRVLWWAAAAVIVGAGGWALTRRPEPAPSLVARGADPRPASAIRVFCLDPTRSPAAVRDVAVDGERLRCGRGDALKFAYSAPRSGGFVAVFSVSRGKVRWYHREDQGAPVEAGRDTPLPGSVDLGPSHAPGPYTLFALYTAEPTSRDEVEAAVSAGAALHTLGTLQRVEFTLGD